jgi:hypothetical protein
VAERVLDIATLTIDNEEPIDKSERKRQESTREKERKNIDECTLDIVEIARYPEYSYHHTTREYW